MTTENTNLAHSSIVVIGAGMAGLAAARYLAQKGAQVTVLEKNARPGGRVQTDTFEDFEIDTGAQFITNFYTNTLNIIAELNLQEAVIPIQGDSAILRSGRLHTVYPLPAALSTDLISIGSKLTLGKALLPVLLHWNELDIHAFHKAYQLDTASVSQYARQALNDELLAYVLQPPLSGILYWTPERTSQAVLFILLKSALGMKLFTLRHGMGQLSEAMAANLHVRYNANVTSVTSETNVTSVTSVTKDESCCHIIKANIEGQECQFRADGVVCAVPAAIVPGIFPDLDTRQRDFFEAVRYAPGVSAAIAINHRLPLKLFDFLCPERELHNLGAAVIASAKSSAQVPRNRDMIQLFSSASAGQHLLNEDEASITETLWSDLQTATVYKGSPLQWTNGLEQGVRSKEEIPCARPLKVYRWQQALPEFDVGHFKRLKAFSEGAIELDKESKGSNVVFAGDYLGGPFIEGAITSGQQAAQRLLQRLPSST